MADDDSKRLDDLHKECIEAFTYHEEAWAENRKLSLEDIKFRAGDHWPEQLKRDREKDGLPCVVVDKVNQYVRQVVNDARQNRPAVKIRPIDDDGDIEVAEAFQGIIRHIFERSNGDIAVDNATECAVVGGYGYYRVTTEYLHQSVESLKSFNQEICVEKVGNPLAVMLGLPGDDPLKAKNGFIIDEMPKKEFKDKYPKAKYTDFDTDSEKYTPSWLVGENIRFCERFYVKEEMVTMHLMADGTVSSDEDYQAFLTERPDVPPPVIEDTRELPERTVKWCRLSGAEILEEEEWLGKYIPLVRVVGNEYNIDGKVIYSGLIRAAKDPQRLYDYMRSSFAQRVSMTPKVPWLIAEGQIEGHETEWKDANKGTVATLTYKETSLDGHPVPPPQRVSATDIPEGYARDMQLSEHDIQASMGMYAASVGQPSNERSGKAIMARQREGDTATFHYQDNAARGTRDFGFICVDLIPKVYDSRRTLRILGEDGESTDAVADPNQEQAVVKMGSKSIYNLNVGTYDVSVDAGPSFNTRRVEQSEAMQEMIHNAPEVMQIAGDLLVKSQDWPGAQELSERFRLMLPPPIQQAIAAEKQGMPPEAAAIVTQANEAVKQRDQQIQEMGQELQKLQLAEQKLQAENINLKTKAAVDNANAQVESLRKEAELIQARQELMQAQMGQDGEPKEFVQTDTGPMPFEEWKVRFEQETKVLLEQMKQDSSKELAVISANAANKDGETQMDETGTPKPSPALAAVVEMMNQNLIQLTEGNKALAEGMNHMAMAAKMPRMAVRDAKGNLTSRVVE